MSKHKCDNKLPGFHSCFCNVVTLKSAPTQPHKDTKLEKEK